MAEISRIDGKTKYALPKQGEPGNIQFFQKDDITAGDGERHDILPGKGVLANATTCHVFGLLARKDVPLAFARQEGDTFIARRCKMISVEIVVRNESAKNGSYGKRHPDVSDGTVFDSPVVEFYYKTTGRQFFGVELECDDPLMLFSDDSTMITLHHPKRPFYHGRPMLRVSCEQMTMAECRALYEHLKVARQLALLVNKHLKAAWEQQGGRLNQKSLYFLSVKFSLGALDTPCV